MRVPAFVPCLFLLGSASFLASVPPAAGTDPAAHGTLPVTLVGFAAEDHRDRVSLTWVADFADVTVAYDIERSADGNIWETVGTVDCGSAPLQARGYQFHDDTPFAGLNHYRLVRRGPAGSVGYTAPLSIVHRAAFGLHVWPNPVDLGQPVHLRYEGAEEHEFQIELVDLLGTRLERWSVESDGGTNQITLSADVPQPGRYFLRVFIDDLPVQAFVLNVK